ncbi:hypothetical protein N5D48_03050 [Pseudomonas sp. GD03858]|uniref:hypothetical protein n=1 Tax=unclassified Pseudomonas TaxID=196821 RepID=UPI00244C9869|nr:MULTISPECIES: hypothetical protein [unclassified Pseudomonas]MDH0647633.1 hypothetical protein [Pseudomonas sp. GD03867]MDH0661366.1 hypothetical protein [Pseudomonas sp. GD03858]
MNELAAICALTLLAFVVDRLLRHPSLRMWTGIALLCAGLLSFWQLPHGDFLGVQSSMWIVFMNCLGTGLFAQRNRYRT